MTPQSHRTARSYTVWPRRLLVCAALSAIAGLLAFEMIGVSDARFTRVSVNPGAVFSSGTSVLVNSKSGSAVINVTGLLPGGSNSGTLALTGQGDYSSTVTLTNAGISDQPSSPALSQALTLTVEDITGATQTLWSGTMSNLPSLSLGQISPGATKTLRFTVAFPTAGAVPGLQNAGTSMTLRFTGVAQ